MSPGYPQYPGYPQKPKSSSTPLLIFLGVFAMLGVGTCAYCVHAVDKVGKDVAVAAASASASAAKEGATFVPLLGKLAADPKALPPKTTKPGKDVTAYTYDDPSGTPLHGLTMTVGKLPHVWLIDFTAASGVGPNDFAPGEADRAPSDEGVEITAANTGPLKGAVVLHDKTKWQVMSANHALHERIGGNKTVEWICDTSRASGVSSVQSGAFKSQCEDLAKERLLSPRSADFPGMFDATAMLTGNDCTRIWKAWVEATNAFNAKIRHNFTCTYDPKTNGVSLDMH